MVGVVILQIIIFESHHLSHAAHADYFLNEMADERAETGCLADADPICDGHIKYGSLQLRIKASLLAQNTNLMFLS